MLSDISYINVVRNTVEHLKAFYKFSPFFLIKSQSVTVVEFVSLPGAVSGEVCLPFSSSG